MTLFEKLDNIWNNKVKLVEQLTLGKVSAASSDSLDSIVAALPSVTNRFVPPGAWVDLRKYTPDGGIGLIVADLNQCSLSFTVTADSSYTVKVYVDIDDDPISENTYSSGAQCDLSFTKGAGKTYRTGVTTYAVFITATNIKTFKTKRASSVTVTNFSGLLWFYGNLTTLLDLSNLLYGASGVTRHTNLQSIYIKSTASVTVAAAMSSYCASLRTVEGDISFAGFTGAATPFFYNCYAVEFFELNPASINCTEFSSAACQSLAGPFDFSSAVNMNRLTMSGMYALTGLTVCSTAPWGGTSPQIDVSNAGMNRDALVALFNSLGTVTGKTIAITGAVGTSSLTADDLAIATGKGWTVTTA